MLRLIRSAVLLAALVSLLCAAGAGAEPTWLGPRGLGAQTDQPATGHAAAVTPDGRVIALATKVVGAGANSWIKADVRSPFTGSFADEQTLQDADGADGARLPQVAVDGSGNAVAAWVLHRSGNDVVRAAVMPPGELEFGRSYDVSLPDAAIGSLAVAIGGGTAVVAWERAGGVITAAVKPDGAAAFGAPADLGGGSAPAVAVSAAGAAIAAWPSATAGAVQASAAPPGGPWTRMADLQTSIASPDDVQLAMAPDGRATAAWVVGAAGPVVPGVWSAQQGVAGADFGAPQQLTAPDAPGGTIALAVDPRDTAIVLAAGSDGLHAFSRPSGGAFSLNPTLLARSGGVDVLPEVGFALNGMAVAAWQQRDDDQRLRLVSRVIDGAGGLGPPHVIDAVPAPGDDFRGPATLGVDDEGNAAVAYELRTDLDPGPGEDWRYEKRYALYDGAGPDLRIVAVPANAVAGRPARFEAVAIDRMTAASLPAWNFPEPLQFPGTVDHVFAAPGTYLATATSVDRVGNSSTASASVTVGPAPPPAPTPPPPPVRAGITARWAPHKTYTSVRSLAVRAPRGVRVVLTCRGSGCPITRRTLTVARARTVSLSTYFNRGKRSRRLVARLKPNAVVRVTVVGAAARGRSWTATIRRGGKAPKMAHACMAVGHTTGAVACG